MTSESSSTSNCLFWFNVQCCSLCMCVCVPIETRATMMIGKQKTFDSVCSKVPIQPTHTHTGDRVDSHYISIYCHVFLLQVNLYSIFVCLFCSTNVTNGRPNRARSIVIVVVAVVVAGATIRATLPYSLSHSNCHLWPRS